MANISLDAYLFLLYFKGKNILSLQKHSTIWKHGTDMKSYPCPRDYFDYTTKMLPFNY